MIITDYYKFERLDGAKSTSRIDCTASTGSHPSMEQLRNKAKELFIYFGNVPDQFSVNARRKADKVISKSKNISSIYVPNVEMCLGYGDFKDTTDALLFVFSNDYTPDNTPPRLVEVFIARGQKNNKNALYNMLSDGQLDDDIEALKKRAVTDLVTK